MKMTWVDWLRPGIMVKRWILLGFIGILLLCGAGIFFYLGKMVWLAIAFLFLGSFLIYIALRKGIYSFMMIVSQNAYININRTKFEKLIYEKRILSRGPKIVAIGGGTGLSTMLRGLKKYSTNLTAIVTVADDGGGSGILRNEMGILPPGDIRNCILALANTEPVMERLLQYRFQEGGLAGQSFGNLFLAAMNGVSESFEDAVKSMSEVLAVTGKVLPVTSENIQLCAKLKNQQIICGESKIVQQSKERKSPIEYVYMLPEKPKALPEALEAIREADGIILGPGSLYTSIIPNLLVDGIREELSKTKAPKIYIGNVMTQPGETDTFSLDRHVEELERYLGTGIIDYVLANTESIPEELIEIYRQDGADPVLCDADAIEKKGLRFVGASVLKIYEGKNLLRHDPGKLALEVIKIIAGWI